MKRLTSPPPTALSVNFFDGHKGILISSLIVAFTTSKHTLYDGLDTPILVKIFTILNLGASLRAYATPSSGNVDSADSFSFLFYASTAVVFAYDPVQPLVDTFPSIEPATPLRALAITQIEGKIGGRRTIGAAREDREHRNDTELAMQSNLTSLYNSLHSFALYDNPSNTAITLFAFAICVNIKWGRPSIKMFSATFSLFPFLIFKHIMVDFAGPPPAVGYVWTALALWLFKDSVTEKSSKNE